jgi:hypothetical protein
MVSNQKVRRKHDEKYVKEGEEQGMNKGRKARNLSYLAFDIDCAEGLGFRGFK